MSKALLSVLTGRFFSSMAQFSIGPFLVVYLNHIVGLSLSDSVLGVGSLTLASRFLAYPLGLVIDRLGAILLLRVSLLICSIAMAVLAANAMTLSPPWLFIILAGYVAGISGMLLTYRTVVIGLVKKAELTPSFSYVSVAFNLGMLAGPAIGAYFADENDYGKVFAFCAMLYALALLFMLKPTGNSPEKPSAPLSAATTENNDSTPLQETKYLRAGYFITYYCLILQTTSLVTMLAPYISHLSRSAKPVSTFFGVQALLVVGLLLVMARFLKHVSPNALTRLYAFSTSLVSIALLVMGLCNEENMTVSLCIAGSLVAISQSIGVPSGNAILVSLASDQKYGKMFGAAAWVEGSAILSSFILGAYLYPRLLNDGEPGNFWLAIALFTLFVLTATSVIRMAHNRKNGLSQCSRL